MPNRDVAGATPGAGFAPRHPGWQLEARGHRQPTGRELFPAEKKRLIREVLETLGVAARLKWPNDLMLDGRKLAGLLPRLRPAPRDPAVRQVLRRMTPALFGVSVTQINLLLDTLIASFLVSGSISWLYYSDRLMEFPLGILGVALATVILPRLSRRQAEDEAIWESFRAWILTHPPEASLQAFEKKLAGDGLSKDEIQSRLEEVFVGDE